MKQVGHTNEKLGKTAIVLGIYFLLLPTDCFRIGAIGSLLKAYALLPVACLFLSGGMRWLMLDKLLIQMFMLLAMASLSSLWSINFEETTASVRSLFLNIILVALMAGTYRYTVKERAFLLRCLVASSWVTVICMLLFSERTAAGRLTLMMGDSTQDPNYVAGYILFAFSYHVTSYLQQKKLRHFFGAAVIFLVVILTGSRGALAAYFACIFFAVVFDIKASRNPVGAAAFAVIFIVAGYFIFNIAMQTVDESIASRFTLEYLLEHGTTGRSRIWLHLLDKFWNASIGRQLFGHGYGTTRLMNTLGGSIKGLVAHNLYIDNLISIGIAGLFIQLGLQLQCIKMAIRTRNRMLICSYGAFLVMSLSLSLTNYKPMWSAIMVIIILQKEPRSSNSVKVMREI